MNIMALGDNYFSISDCPINICRIKSSKNITHNHDLTEIEHIHDFVEVVIIVQGHGTQVVERHEYPVSSGDVFVLQGNQKHYFKDSSQLEIVNVMFDEANCPGMIPEKIKLYDGFKALFVLEPKYRNRHHFKNSLRLQPKQLAQVEMILNSMFYEIERSQQGFEILLTNLLQELIVKLSRFYSRIETKEAQSLLRLANIIEEMETQPQKKVLIEDLAKRAYMSPRNFQRVFNRALGISPQKYLLQSRLQKSVQLLIDTDYPVADIAIMSGFSDSNHLIKKFRTTYGTTPNKYRQKFSN
jgi:AraC-like DNA-binding protein